jgi:hypothetical protein
MSWETFVVGTLKILPVLSEEKKAKILDEFEEVLETDLIALGSRGRVYLWPSGRG